MVLGSVDCPIVEDDDPAPLFDTPTKTAVVEFEAAQRK